MMEIINQITLLHIAGFFLIGVNVYLSNILINRVKTIQHPKKNPQRNEKGKDFVLDASKLNREEFLELQNLMARIEYLHKKSKLNEVLKDNDIKY